MTTIAQLLTDQKRVLGLSDRELGRRMITPVKPDGVSETAIETWRKGNSRPTQIPPEVIAAGFELDPSEVYAALGVTQANATPPHEDDQGDTVERILDSARRLPPPELHSLFDFAEFLVARAELRAWTASSSGGLAQLYGEDEPEYTIADHRP